MAAEAFFSAKKYGVREQSNGETAGFAFDIDKIIETKRKACSV
jgi:hypothetical protein